MYWQTKLQYSNSHSNCISACGVDISVYNAQGLCTDLCRLHMAYSAGFPTLYVIPCMRITHTYNHVCYAYQIPILYTVSVIHSMQYLVYHIHLFKIHTDIVMLSFMLVFVITYISISIYIL